MSNPCLNVGHAGASGVVGQKQIKSLLDVTTHIEDYFKQSDVSFRCERNPKGSLVPGGVGVFQFKRAGEGIFYSNGLPVLFVTRLSSENGCDANIGKWYRKQWYYENYLRKINPDCTHLTFIHASESTGILSTLIAGVSMVMAQDFNQHTSTHIIKVAILSTIMILIEVMILGMISMKRLCISYEVLKSK